MPTAITDRAAGAERSTEFIDASVIDPASGEQWPHFMDTTVVQRYLHGLGIAIARQTLNHHRAAGRGIKWRYLGQKPVTTKAEVDRFVSNEMFSDASPLVGRKRVVRKQ